MTENEKKEEIKKVLISQYQLIPPFWGFKMEEIDDDRVKVITTFTTGGKEVIDNENFGIYNFLEHKFEEKKITNIKEAREQEHLTQAEVAKILGVSKRTIEEWERGTRNPKGGHKPLIEKIKIAGYLTPEGRAALIDGDVSWEEATSFYKVAIAKRKCSIGAFGDTFSAILDSVPESVFNALTGEQLGELIDALKGAYDKGVAYGKKHHKEDE